MIGDSSKNFAALVSPEPTVLKLRLFVRRVSRPVDFDTFLVGPGGPTYGMHGEFDLAQLQKLTARRRTTQPRHWLGLNKVHHTDTAHRIDSLGKISGTKRCAAMSNRNPVWPFSGGLPHNNSANSAIFDLQLRVSETQHVCSGLDKM